MVGERIVGYVLVSTEVGKEHEIARKILQGLKGRVTEVVITYGIYDLVVRFEINSFKESNEIVTFIRELSGVRRTETLLGFQASEASE